MRKPTESFPPTEDSAPLSRRLYTDPFPTRDAKRVSNDSMPRSCKCESTLLRGSESRFARRLARRAASLDRSPRKESRVRTRRARAPRKIAREYRNAWNLTAGKETRGCASNKTAFRGICLHLPVTAWPGPLFLRAGHRPGYSRP